MDNTTINGNLTDFEELVKLLKFLGEDVIFKLHNNEEKEISIYSLTNNKFAIYYNEKPITLATFKKKISNWFLNNKGYITFSIIPILTPPSNISPNFLIDKEDFFNVIEQLQYLRSLPSKFKIEIVNPSKVPKKIFLLNGKELTADIINSTSLSLLDLIELSNKKYIKIKKISFIEKLAPAVGFISFTISILLIGYIFFLPFNKKLITIIKIQENLNPIMAKLVIGRKVPEKLPVKDGYFNNLYFKNGYIISPGKDRKLGTEDDIKIKIPKNIKPLFAVP